MAQDFQPHLTGQDGTLQEGEEQWPQGLLTPTPTTNTLVRPWATPGGSVGAPWANVNTCPGMPIVGFPVAGGPILAQPKLPRNGGNA